MEAFLIEEDNRIAEGDVIVGPPAIFFWHLGHIDGILVDGVEIKVDVTCAAIVVERRYDIGLTLAYKSVEVILDIGWGEGCLWIPPDGFRI